MEKVYFFKDTFFPSIEKVLFFHNRFFFSPMEKVSFLKIDFFFCIIEKSYAEARGGAKSSTASGTGLIFTALTSKICPSMQKLRGFSCEAIYFWLTFHLLDTFFITPDQNSDFNLPWLNLVMLIMIAPNSRALAQLPPRAAV